MGYLKNIGAGIIYIGVILAVLAFAPGLPPDANFTEYNIVSPKELTGFLALNDRLNNPEILFKGKLHGPEAFASYNGELYTGVHGGYIVKIKENDEFIPIAKFGKQCEGDWQEHICGRPLGLKFNKNGELFVADAYYGIFKLDVTTGKYEKIVDIKKPIDGKAPNIVNSLDVASNGDIYWTDSSSEFALHDGVYTILADPNGRLLRYNAKTKKNEVLVKDLGFANGVFLSEDESFVLAIETLTSRVTKYNLKGPKAGKQEIFIEGLPGLPDNVHSDGQGGILLSLFSYADAENPALFQSLTPHPNIRRVIVRFMYILEAPLKLLQTYYPNYYTEKIIHSIGHFASVSFLGTKYSTILRLDTNGKIIDVAYGTDGKLSSISSAFVFKDHLWLGSPMNDFAARVPLKQAFPSLATSPKKTGTVKTANSIPEEPKKAEKQTTKDAPKAKSEKPSGIDAKVQKEAKTIS
ncbi:adipocyte plasma membrane-associated protein-like [Belonocnema kinseyi]|uniref:adipocyte plasma membrane-associated protein-like n=1 Tax=Belonocnema kinseyi TaxID=2817044 RepID=UPI00143DD172|nr:adipocyte plasma membrane-associated protein-like [Belonocnema kinseyi]